MTAIGAMPEGIDEAEVARRVDAVDTDPGLLAEYAADVRHWIVGPYTGTSDAVELRIRGAVVVDALVTRLGRPNGRVSLDAPVAPEGPGSDTDPAYSSPTPGPGPEGLAAVTDSVAADSKADAGDDVVVDPAPGELERSAPGAEPELPEGRRRGKRP